MNDYMVAYTVCDKKKMIRDLLISLRSLSRFVPRDKVVVFFTSPYDDKAISIISKFAEVRCVDNVTMPFTFKKDRPPGNYGESVQCCGVDSDTLVLLDCDTVVKRDIRLLLENDNYDVFARPGTGNRYLDPIRWVSLFELYGKKPVPMFNKGFMVFKNGVHREIKNLWLHLINDPSFLNPHCLRNPKEQVAFSVAVSGYDIRFMNKHHHAFGWNGEGWVKTFVLHKCSRNGFYRFFRNLKGDN